ncbi:conserved hypothetical protein [Xylanimonas cellulosilytica DSM 15894]|uniref:MobA-like NTP transferase domain-containing protein n=1 Tax=Xylanimonas cellulosilytica (strain DSM 15894 / JCM 12276 / CECT 5975 / KCTC 9989 / LMG 20990 / NBRC 107835 / XIL07) TaxID=446471 RepID=D1BT08_XYLCX|nr:NTP transferase domain-containing protein [Xylanimonas cellulosilytica]ACZ30850.1 conserved hypothetical protein [Xylanimonas cellulosilytica DSM 15894]
MLAGGRASRLRGTPKPGLLLDGSRLLDRALAAVAGAAATAVVGPDDLAGTVGTAILTREDPPFGGPVAGIDAGLRALDRPGAPGVVVLLAVDVPGASRAVPRLLAALTDDADGACLDRDGHPQWLIAAIRRDRLTGALVTLHAQAGSVHDQPVRRLVAPLRLVGVPDDDGASDDVDTWDDLARLEAAARKGMR